MAYDEDVADRLRTALADEPGLTERKMFGGLGFMLDGNMAVAAGSGGDIMLRVAPERTDELLDGERYRPMEMRGRAMKGWLLVSAASLTTQEELQEVVQIGVDYVRSLPPK